ncbi:cardiolipin synthase [Sphingobacterium rhinopitheci]|uniref:cardiolipin synthase n=1 Tax=Sphingobacterium rhinopitheci TaxID=2781960 RepID=UPI001F527BAD|nr:cardiolipin synthase [Sphingobacterium rhinopitheci]MCI0920170.1 cardiolipin synthase [Sphingobacterium rhinopitheci]
MEIFEALEPFWDFARNWYWIPLLLLYAGVISTILIENGNPTKTIAWILVIVFLPLVGLILYYFFGQKYVKVQKIKRINRQQTVKLEKKWRELDPIMDSFIQDIHEKIGDLSKVYRLMKKERLSLPTLNNNVQLLINGEQKFPLFIADLLNAKHSIHMEYYIFETDSIGTQILDILENKAREGIIVRLLVDNFGSPQLVKYMRKKQDSKILFYAFLPVTFTSLANSNYRNHRKIAVIDGAVGYIGGINISDKYINDPKNTKQVYWRDTAVRFEGNAVNMLQLSFWSSWNQTEGIPFLLEDGYLKINRDKEMGSGAAGVGFVSSDPASIGPFNMEALLLAIGEAHTSVRLCTPYYIPSQELERALIVAASSGVNVELMIPNTSDSFLVRHASLSFLKPLLQRNVKVYLYNKGFLHAKTVTIDDKLSFVGTVNLDIRSFYINYEIAAIISDPPLCIQLQNQFEQDKKESTLLNLSTWEARSRLEKAIDSVCRLLAPLL